MSSKTKSTLKLISIIIVIVMVLMQLGIISIPFLMPYKFWLMVTAAIILLLVG